MIWVIKTKSMFNDAILGVTLQCFQPKIVHLELMRAIKNSISSDSVFINQNKVELETQTSVIENG